MAHQPPPKNDSKKLDHLCLLLESIQKSLAEAKKEREHLEETVEIVFKNIRILFDLDRRISELEKSNDKFFAWKKELVDSYKREKRRG